MKKTSFLSIACGVAILSGCAAKEDFIYFEEPYHIEYGTEITQELLKKNITNSLSDDINFSVDGRNEESKNYPFIAQFKLNDDGSIGDAITLVIDGDPIFGEVQVYDFENSNYDIYK